MKTRFFSWFILPLLLAGLIAAACGPATPTAPPPSPTLQVEPQGEASPPSPPPAQPSPVAGGLCGDGKCDGPENAENCPQDCAQATPHTSTQRTAPHPVPAVARIEPGPDRGRPGGAPARRADRGPGAPSRPGRCVSHSGLDCTRAGALDRHRCFR